MLGIVFLPDRLRAGGVGSGDGAGAGEEGGVWKVSSSGRGGGGEGVGVCRSWSVIAGTAGSGVVVVAGTGCGGGCDGPDGDDGDGGDGPGSVGVTEENFRKNCRFLSVTLPLPSTLILYLL